MNDKRLVAYYTTRDGELEVADRTGELRAHLAAALPEHMVPAAYVHLRALPLTRNGRIDRQALPVPDVGIYAARGYEAPVGDVEGTLARLWAEVLGVARVGRHDNFFELGGHSLFAVGLMERMRREGLRASVSAIFTTPTLSALATSVDVFVEVVL